MIRILDKAKCSGCTACVNVCPKGCISMKPDEEGFLYPHVEQSECVECGKCEKVCPVLHPFADKKGQRPEAVIARTGNEKILQDCTSGGVFTAMALAVIQDGGVVFGAVYREDFSVAHEKIESAAEIHRLMGSKYVQSEMGTVFLQVREELDKGRKVLFSGTPCQIAGIRNFLGIDHDTLFLVDLVCHGVPSPKLWMAYVDYVQKKYGKLQYVNFRSKRLGYHVSVMEERFENGRIRIGSARTNLMSKCFFRDVADRPICYECPFKTVNRCSDLTIFDSWHAGDLAEGLKDDDRGYTSILIQSEKGKFCLGKYGTELKQYFAEPMKLLKADGRMAVNSVQKPAERDTFYIRLNRDGIGKTVEDMMPISWKDHAIEKLKIILYKTGVLKLLKVKRK